MMFLISILDIVKDGQRVFVGSRFDHDFLESSFERTIFLNGFAELIKGRRANALDVATAQGRLQHVCSIHRALGIASAHHLMYLVDIKNDVGILFQFANHVLESFLKLTAVLGSCNQASHVERHDALVGKQPAHFLVHYSLSKAFDYGTLAHARFAEQDRVVLLAARKDLRQTFNL